MARELSENTTIYDDDGRIVSLSSVEPVDLPTPSRSTPRVEIAVGQVDEEADAALRDALDALVAELGGPSDAFAFSDAEMSLLAPETELAKAADEPDEGSPAAEPDEPSDPTPPEEKLDAEWVITPMTDGRQDVTPDGRLVQAALGNRNDGIDLVGTWRAEALRGTDGDDVIAALRGADTIAGGAGPDLFVFAQMGEGQNWIEDFEADKDALYWDAEILFDLEDLAIRQDGGDTVIEWHFGTSSVRLENVLAADLSEDHLLIG
ncbi:hypothetical protein [Pontivivens insulae]|uniref:Serralysin B n=1 Tax=Pontivivens insulae TaxID=1639689 RepID=A0A2R8AFK0_9RHOB|nr:hypothetical protein [Pontivivens insulae]RED12254.1 hypothetical protein DFR53_2971 [Pontivivens insulae]SPF31011.1 Serralysin B [Pontivivens insulae]